MSRKKFKAKEPVRIRFKPLAGGNKSIYLDKYVDGKREYEFLKLYLVPERTGEDKEANANAMKIAMTMKSQRIMDIQNNAHGMVSNSDGSKIKLLNYVQDYANKKKEIASQSTYVNYLALRRHLELYKGDKIILGQIDKDYCQGFINYLKSVKSDLYKRPLSENTQDGYMTKLEAVINCAIMEGLMNGNPFKQIKSDDKPKARPGEVKFLTIDEVNALIKTPFENHQNIKNAFLFSCFTGLRYSDITRLTWDKIQKDSNNNTVIAFVQKKTKKQEYLPISSKALQYLPEKSEDIVFKLPMKGRINDLLRRWAETAKIKKHITFHVARHTNATLLLSLGVPIETISKILGHSDIQTTQIYAKVMDKSKRDAVDKLDELF